MTRSRAQQGENAAGAQCAGDRRDRSGAIVEPVQCHRAHRQIHTGIRDTHVQDVSDPKGDGDVRRVGQLVRELIEHGLGGVDTGDRTDPVSPDQLHGGEPGTARDIQDVAVVPVGQRPDQTLGAGTIERHMIVVVVCAAIEAVAGVCRIAGFHGAKRTRLTGLGAVGCRRTHRRPIVRDDVMTSEPYPAALGNAPAWTRLIDLAATDGQRHLRDLFADDPTRGERYRVSGAGLELDYAKQRVTDAVLAALIALAEEAGLEEHRARMFAGAHINTSEDRAVLHVALRMPRDRTLVVDGSDVVAGVHAVLERMGRFADAVRSGDHRGHTGRPLRNVINIGIGGSDLGPVMAGSALTPYETPGMRFRFVSNVDGDAILDATADLDPAETLVVVSSKTFTTRETMTNAHTARAWLVDALGDEAAIARHVVAVSTNGGAVRAFGIDPANMFGFWDWVGGRYSMDSAIGLSTMIAVGPDRFAELLAGFHAMDEHFLHTPAEANLPVLMGLIAVWNRNFLGAPTTAVLPYSQHLHRFPAYLQQLTMESNGKHVTATGAPVGVDTGAIYWGEPGTNGQHSFYQLLHQGTTIVPADLIGILVPDHPLQAHHDFLMANLVAQAEAMAFGRTEGDLRAAQTPAELVPHKQMDGNRPTSVLLADRLTPHALGALVALYEHSVFVQSVIWGIDAFDQWGVELGKQLATRIADEITATATPSLTHDSSTNALIRRIRASRAPGVSLG